MVTWHSWSHLGVPLGLRRGGGKGSGMPCKSGSASWRGDCQGLALRAWLIPPTQLAWSSFPLGECGLPHLPLLLPSLLDPGWLRSWDLESQGDPAHCTWASSSRLQTERDCELKAVWAPKFWVHRHSVGAPVEEEAGRSSLTIKDLQSGSPERV